MSTRSKTRLAAASTSKEVPIKQDKKPKSRSSRTAQPLKTESDQQEKENVKVKAPKGATKTPSTKKKTHKVPQPVYCTCQKGDDGTPMVFCGGCNVWYHFECINLDEKDAEEINVYICPSCAESTGLRTAMVWEGPEALEESARAEPAPVKELKKKKSVEARPKRSTPVHLPSESEDEPSSADEYVAEDPKSKPKAGKRQTRRISISSESATSDDDVEPHGKRASARVSASPAPSRRLKRKNDHTSHTPPIKRHKVSDINPTDDPTRKYCLSKLEELFRDIFLKYPHVRDENVDNDGGKAREKGIIEKPLDELTEEEKTTLLDESKEFAVELEKCVFSTYSEPDKHGNPSAGSNYKDRFRMLQFNLSKNDRVVIHQRIASFLLTPKEISLMSSTDLANEETKQSIKLAEKEALEYSILTPTAIPRAKITHKGLEDIEDVHGEVTSIQDQERARLEEEERRERERTERLKAQKRQRTASMSVPPESPVVHQDNASWGAPPPVPLHAMALSEESQSHPSGTLDQGGPPATLPFGNTALDTTMYEPEIDLADFLNMDDETSTTEAPTNVVQAHQPPNQLAVTDTPATTDTPTLETATATIIVPPPSTPTGISPFAAKPETPTSSSFNLNALWSAPTKEDPPPTPPQPATEHESPPPVQEEPKDIVLGSDNAGPDDLDFDMFLEEKDPSTSADALQAAFDALPQVWSGKINMPLDSTIPSETPVVARQMGGRSLWHESALWKTLFPSDLLRIDGRVPVENSSKFLLQMRMNATKELIGVAFSPTSESSVTGFRILSDFLIAKGRHGLVFPWGNRPKDYHPGRELYIIPLLSSDPLPEYMELLDELHLPKIRKSNYLVGIWVLNKGKLAPPPPPPSILPTPTLPQLPPNIHLPKHNFPPSTSSIPPFNPSPAPPLPATIAAEVASLTPEQIELMIQTLRANPAIPLPIPTQTQPQPMPPPTSVQQPHMPILPPGPSQPWENHSHSYGAYHPPLPPPSHPNIPPPPQHHTSHPPASWDRDRRDYPHQQRPGAGYNDRGGDRNGWRGRGRGRGRGSDIPSKPLDSGWPRRPRNDSGPPGPSSPGRRW